MSAQPLSVTAPNLRRRLRPLLIAGLLVVNLAGAVGLAVDPQQAHASALGMTALAVLVAALA